MGIGEFQVEEIRRYREMEAIRSLCKKHCADAHSDLDLDLKIHIRFNDGKIREDLVDALKVKYGRIVVSHNEIIL